jgi:hypothetical protein
LEQVFVDFIDVNLGELFQMLYGAIKQSPCSGSDHDVYIFEKLSQQLLCTIDDPDL